MFIWMEVNLWPFWPLTEFCRATEYFGPHPWCWTSISGKCCSSTQQQTPISAPKSTDSSTRSWTSCLFFFFPLNHLLYLLNPKHSCGRLKEIQLLSVHFPGNWTRNWTRAKNNLSCWSICILPPQLSRKAPSPSPCPAAEIHCGDDKTT